MYVFNVTLLSELFFQALLDRLEKPIPMIPAAQPASATAITLPTLTQPVKTPAQNNGGSIFNVPVSELPPQSITVSTPTQEKANLQLAGVLHLPAGLVLQSSK